MDIYVLQGKEQLGPYTSDEINARLSRGQLTASTLAWFEGSPEWVPLGTVPGISESKASVPPAVSGNENAQFRVHGSRGRDNASCSAPEPGSGQPASDTKDSQQRFYEQVVQAFLRATSHLMQPFDQVDDTVRANKPLDPTVFFRLFLRYATKFNEDCTMAFATVLRQSTRVDAVRATTVRQLAKEIRAEAFEKCDAALAQYHQTVNNLMDSAAAAIEKADGTNSPISPTGGALLGSLVAGKGSRVAGAAVGGLAAFAGTMNTLNRQLALHGQALELIEQAEAAAPKHVAEYLGAVGGMPEALVDLLGAKCFGGAADVQAQQSCTVICVEHVRKLNTEAAESVRAMYEHLGRLTAAAEAEEAREAGAQQQEQKARDRVVRYIKLAIFLPLWVALDYAFMDGDYSSTGVIMGGVTTTVCIAMLWFVFSLLIRAIRF